MNRSSHRIGTSTAPARPESASPSPEQAGAPAPADNRPIRHDWPVSEIPFILPHEELDRPGEATEAERAAYFDFYHSAPIGYCTLDGTGKIQEANLATSTLLAVPAVDLPGQPFIRYLHPDDHLSFQQLCHQLYTAPGTRSCEARLLRPDGTTRWAHLTVHPVPAGHGAGGQRLFLNDITRSKQTESDLRESDRRFRDLVDSTDGIVWQADATTFAFHSVSKNAERLLGYPVEDWLQPGFWAEHILPEDREQAVSYCVDCTRRSQDHVFEYRFLARDGRVVWLHDRVKVVAENGRPRWLHGLMLDISDRKRIEQEKNSIESRLRQSQKMEAIGQLAGGIAHDFNNLLTGILGHAALLQTEKLTAAQRDMLEQITQTGNRAASLSRQLLLFSRREIPVQHDLDLNLTVTEILKLLRRVLGENFDLQLVLEKDPQLVHADASMLDQVLLNLVLNARDAMIDGGKLLIRTEAITFRPDPATGRLTEWHGTEPRHGHDRRITAIPADHSASFQARAGQFTCLSVTDEGCGITPEVSAHIFEPFFTTKEPGRGTGLGLATVYGIVQQHQGWIEVESRPGAGSTFRVYLPRLAAALPPAMVAPEATPDLSAHGETILLVEDETSVRTVLRIFMERSGYRVIECASGAAAWELWPKHRGEINLLLTDMVMPGAFGGVQLAQKLLKDRPDLKVIITSGFSANLDKDRKKFATPIAFIPKPFDQKKVLAVIRAELDDQKIARK